MKKVVIGLMLFCVSAAQADVVVSYDYNSAAGKDPTSQGWTVTSSSASNNQIGAYDAGTGWRIVDGTTGYFRYHKELTAYNETLKTGWVATWKFSLDSVLYSDTGGTIDDDFYLPGTYPTKQNDNGLYIDAAGTNGFHYALFATSDMNGNLAIQDGQTLHVLTSGGNNLGFDKMVTVSIVYNGSTAKLSYEGQTFDLYKQVSWAVDRLRFGSQYLNDRGSVVYNAITLSTIPEPATMVLLGLGGLLCRKSRKA